MLVLYLRLSGLIVDVFGDLAVIASSAAWVEKYKQEIEGSISRIDEINHINWRPSVEILKEEGINLSDLKEIYPSACPGRTKVGNPLKHYIFLISNCSNVHRTPKDEPCCTCFWRELPICWGMILANLGQLKYFLDTTISLLLFSFL
jgi:hypothetical protein